MRVTRLIDWLFVDSEEICRLISTASVLFYFLYHSQKTTFPVDIEAIKQFVSKARAELEGVSSSITFCFASFAFNLLVWLDYYSRWSNHANLYRQRWISREIRHWNTWKIRQAMSRIEIKAINLGIVRSTFNGLWSMIIEQKRLFFFSSTFSLIANKIPLQCHTLAIRALFILKRKQDNLNKNHRSFRCHCTIDVSILDSINSVRLKWVPRMLVCFICKRRRIYFVVVHRSIHSEENRHRLSHTDHRWYYFDLAVEDLHLSS